MNIANNSLINTAYSHLNFTLLIHICKGIVPLRHITDSVYFREYFADVRKDLLCNYTINTKLPSFTFKLGANSAQNRIVSLENAESISQSHFTCSHA